jgi:hypothetical protein
MCGEEGISPNLVSAGLALLGKDSGGAVIGTAEQNLL